MNKQGTEFVVALIPLDGYVKVLGEHIKAVAPEMRRYAFNSKAVGQHAAVITTSPIANLIFAIFTYWLIFIIGVPGVRSVMDEVTLSSVVARTQITKETELRAIDSIEMPDWDAVCMQLVTKIGNPQAIPTVAPLGTNQCQDKTADLRHQAFEPNRRDSMTSLGIQPRSAQIDTVLAKVQAGSATQKTGLQTGDRIIKVDGQPSAQWMAFVSLMRDNPGKALVLGIERQGSVLPLALTPDAKTVKSKAEGFARAVPKIIPLPGEYKTVHQYGPFAAITEATDRTWQLTSLTVRMPGKLMTGDVKLDNLSGPISVTQGAGILAEFELTYYLMFFALISMNPEIINLFPPPVPDGRRLLSLAIEELGSRSVSERVQGFNYRTGSILLVLLVGLILSNDFPRL